MPNLRIDNALNEFEFTVQEALAARTLSPLQAKWYQTKYAQIFKEKASKIIPEDTGFDRAFLLAIGELEGKLTMLTELFNDHVAAMADLSDPSKTELLKVDGNPVVDTTATRASNLVNQNPNN